LTTQLLSVHLPVPIDGLHMRPDGDFRSNVAVKREIHNKLALTYEIRAATDDDPEIVFLWQEIGIPVAMVLEWGELLIESRDWTAQQKIQLIPKTKPKRRTCEPRSR
jgi:hypothetical protein